MNYFQNFLFGSKTVFFEIESCLCIRDNCPVNKCSIILFTLFLGAFILSSQATPETEKEEGPWYLFTSFRDNGQDGLHLSLSNDGYRWTPLNGDKSYLKPTVNGKLMRDPAIARGPEGVFHMVWTSGWTAKEAKMFGYASSTNLIDWSPQKGVPVMQNEPKTRNIWAPELFYDSKEKLWYIFWSSTVTGKFPDETGVSEDQYNHRAYYVTTRDFETFSESRLYFDPGFNIIDATMAQDGERYLLVFKDERLNPVKKNLRMATAESPAGPFTDVSEPFTLSWVEGPSLLKIGDTWFCYFDHYANPHYYGAVRSKDLKNWEDCSKEMQFPAGHRHGTVIQIDHSIAKGLLEHQKENNTQ